MKYKLSDFFPVSQKDLDEFEQNVKHPKEFPSSDSFSKLMEAKRAAEALNEYQTGRKKPTSIGMLVDIFCKAHGKDKSSLGNDLGINVPDWQSVLTNKKYPDTLPARAYAIIAKTLSIPFQAIKEAVIGSFRLTETGTTNSGSVFARSHYSSDNKSRYSQDMKNAMEELLIKGSAKQQNSHEQKINDFVKEIKKCMM